MSATASLESLREALQGEHSQLENWVQESFAAMDSLHSELADWQRDLTRQQALLDQREAALSEGLAASESAAVGTLEARLSEAQAEISQLEEENAEQLHAIEELDRNLALVKAELRSANKRADELAASLEAERERAAEDHRHLGSELREVRRLLERQGSVLDRLAEVSHEGGVSTAEEAPDDGPLHTDGLAAELLRRATHRRAQRKTS